LERCNDLDSLSSKSDSSKPIGNFYQDELSGDEASSLYCEPLFPLDCRVVPLVTHIDEGIDVRSV
jgi:hypothetical protein